MTQNDKDLMMTLKTRFQANMDRHKGLTWEEVESKIQGNNEALKALAFMEETGGEPDVITHPAFPEGLVFADFVPESPSGRRSICYDVEALNKRKENKPRHSAMGMAQEQGLQLVNEAQYQALQEAAVLDNKTSSWILTPEHIRKQGGAFFMNRHYGQVFLYYNGAESYYSSRGFRAFLVI